MAKVICDNCPLFQYGDAYDSTCGLKYKIEHVMRGMKNYIDDKGFESDECGLEFIRFAGGEFHPMLRPPGEI